MLDGGNPDSFFSGSAFLYIEASRLDSICRHRPSLNSLLWGVRFRERDFLEMQVEQSAFASLCLPRLPQSGGTSDVQSVSGMCSGATVLPDRLWWDVVLSRLTGIHSPVYLFVFLLAMYRLSSCIGGQLEVSHCKGHMDHLVVSRKEHQAVIIAEKLTYLAITSNETQ